MGLDLLHEMLKKKIEPNLITYSAVIRACVKADQRDIALELLKEMPDKCSASVSGQVAEPMPEDEDEDSEGENESDEDTLASLDEHAEKRNSGSAPPEGPRRSSLFTTASFGEMNIG